MALANGHSRMTCSEYSLHSETMVELLKMFIPDIDIQVDPIDVAGKSKLIQIRGIGYDLNRFV
jgi:hypothetical protein